MRGWEIHASQKDYVREIYGLHPSFLYRLYDNEHYFLDISDA